MQVAKAGADDHLLPLDQTDVSSNGRESQKKSPHHKGGTHDEGLFQPILNAGYSFDIKGLDCAR